MNVHERDVVEFYERCRRSDATWAHLGWDDLDEIMKANWYLRWAAQR